MILFLLIAAIGSVTIAVWSALFGRENNLMFGVLWDNEVLSLKLPPFIGKKFMWCVEIVTGMAVVVCTGHVFSVVSGIGNLGFSLVTQNLTLGLIGLGGLLLYVIVFWEIVYVIVCLFMGLMALIWRAMEVAIGWVLKNK